MWLFTSIGFYSVVQAHEDPGTVLVRARVRADLEALRDQHLPDIEIVETRERDYRFRALVAREDWARAATGLAAAIDYPNFKDAVSARQGHARASRYGTVWSVMYELQRATSE